MNPQQELEQAHAMAVESAKNHVYPQVTEGWDCFPDKDFVSTGKKFAVPPYKVDPPLAQLPQTMNEWYAELFE